MLDDVLAATDAAPATIAAPATKMAYGTPLETRIVGETAETAYLALAEHYDAKRDAAIELLARVVAGYGKEVQSRGRGMTAAIAAPLLAEMRRLIEAAESINTSATRNRRAHHDAK